MENSEIIFFFDLIMVKQVIRDFMFGFPEVDLVAQINENKNYVKKYFNIWAYNSFGK